MYMLWSGTFSGERVCIALSYLRGERDVLYTEVQVHAQYMLLLMPQIGYSNNKLIELKVKVKDPRKKILLM